MPIFVNKTEITDDEVHAEMQHHPAGNIDDARQKAAEALVIRQLLLQEATTLKLIDNAQEPALESQEEAIDALLEQEISVPQANEEICERYYRQNLDRKSVV